MRSSNEKLIKAQEEENQVNVVIVKSIIDIQQNVPSRSNLDNDDQERRSVESCPRRYA